MLATQPHERFFGMCPIGLRT